MSHPTQTNAAVRRLAQVLRKPVGAVSATIRLATVDHVSAGAAADGNAAVFIALNSDVVAAPYLKSYATPTAGDLVAVLFSNGAPLILGEVIGLPSF